MKNAFTIKPGILQLNKWNAFLLRDTTIQYNNLMQNYTLRLIMIIFEGIRKIDVAFACTSKNFGVSGANITVIRKNVLEKCNSTNLHLGKHWC